MYKYFVPDSDAKESKIIAQAPSVNSLKEIVPLYNEQGEFHLFIGASF